MSENNATTMMTVGTLLVTLGRLKVDLIRNGDKLVATPASRLDFGLRYALARHKPVILRCLDLAGPGKPVKMLHLMRALRDAA